jgi:excisionase family DNA binding protein
MLLLSLTYTGERVSLMRERGKLGDTQSLNNLLTTAEVAKRLGVDQSRVRQFIANGQMPAIKKGRDWLIAESDLKAFKRLPKGSPGKPRKLER